MRALTRIALLAAFGAAFLAGGRSNAELTHMEIRSARQLPEGLTIKAESRDRGMIAFDVVIDPEQVAHADALYKGRVKSNAVLTVSVGGAELSSVTVHGTAEGKRTHYYFRLSPSAAKSSELQLGVSLHEKDGHPTLGGGVSMQIHLAGFDPANQAEKGPPKR